MSGDRYNTSQVPSWAIPTGAGRRGRRHFRQHKVPDRRHHGVQGDGTARHAAMPGPSTALRPVSRRGGLEARAGGCWHCASSISPASAPTSYPYNQRPRKSVPPVLARLPLRYAHSEAGQTGHLSCLRIPLILISHSGRSRSPIPVILITLFTVPEEGTADSMTWRWTATTDG